MKRMYLIHPLETYGNVRENREKEKEIAADILRHNENIELVRPFKEIPHDIERGEAMLQCLDLIETCDGVITTPDWSKSEGCREEVDFAYANGKMMRSYKPKVKHLIGGPVE